MKRAFFVNVFLSLFKPSPLWIVLKYFTWKCVQTRVVCQAQETNVLDLFYMWSHDPSGSDLPLYLEILKAGFVIEIEDKRVLSEQQVRDFYSRIADQVRKLKEKKSHCVFKDSRFL